MSKHDQTDILSVKLIEFGINKVGVPYDTSWRILPYTVLTSISANPAQSSGKGICEFGNGKRLERKPGTSILIPRNVKHRFTNMEHPHTSVWIHWDVSIAPDLDLFSFCDVPDIIRGESSLRIAEFCERIVHTDAFGLQRTVRIQQLLYALLETMLEECSIRKEYHNYITAYRTWLPLLSHVDSNLSAKLNLSDLTIFRNCSLSKLQRDFTTTFGQPLGDFIIKRRLNYASQLTCNSNLTLAEIAEQTGFSDAFALSKSFRKCYGLSPREYRKISFR